MKQIYVVFIMMFFSCVMCHAQAKRKNVQNKPTQQKEYKVEMDGFEWYLIYENGKYGAEDKYHNLLIPTEYSEVDYNISTAVAGIPSGFWAK